MIRKVAILANGGDVSGFNAVIRAIIKTAENNGIDCYGFIDGYNGLLKNNFVKLATSNNSTASGILPKGGSIIGSSTNANVFNYKVVNEDGSVEYKDLSDVCVENIKKDGFDCIFTLGGDGTQKSARDFSTKEEVEEVAKKMRDIALANEEYSEDVKQAFKDAYKEIKDELTLSNLKEIKKIIEED